MALRKFLFRQTTEGYVEDQDPTDELSIGKLTLLGVGGVGLDAGANPIINVPLPVLGTDAVNKNYVDAFSGLPAATQIGNVLYSLNGATFTNQTPLTSTEGWLVMEDGVLMVVG